MNTSNQPISARGADDILADFASIVAVVLIGLVLLVLANPRLRTDLDTIWQHYGTHSGQVTQQWAAR